MNINNGLYNSNYSLLFNSSLVWLLALLSCLDKQMQCILQVMVGITTQNYCNKTKLWIKKLRCFWMQLFFKMYQSIQWIWAEQLFTSATHSFIQPITKKGSCM